MKKTILILAVCMSLSGCFGLFKKQEPVVQVVKEVHVVKEQVPDNLLIPCTRHGDLPYGISPLDSLNIIATRRVENNSCADQIDNIKIWRDTPGRDE